MPRAAVPPRLGQRLDHIGCGNRPYNVWMPKLTVEGFGEFDVAEGKRLVLAIEQDAHVDILHACGGNARCTTCRVEFIAGEPEQHTAAELERLARQRGYRRVYLTTGPSQPEAVALYLAAGYRPLYDRSLPSLDVGAHPFEKDLVDPA